MQLWVELWVGVSSACRRTLLRRTGRWRIFIYQGNERCLVGGGRREGIFLESRAVHTWA
jgi:hypothetical protein